MIQTGTFNLIQESEVVYENDKAEITIFFENDVNVLMFERNNTLGDLMRTAEAKVTLRGANQGDLLLMSNDKYWHFSTPLIAIAKTGPMDIHIQRLIVDLTIIDDNYRIPIPKSCKFGDFVKLVSVRKALDGPNSDKYTWICQRDGEDVAVLDVNQLFEFASGNIIKMKARSKSKVAPFFLDPEVTFLLIWLIHIYRLFVNLLGFYLPLVITLRANDTLAHKYLFLDQ